MLLKIIWDLCMNSFAPKNIPLQQILSSWGTGIDSPLVAPKSLGFAFKTNNSQKLVPEWNRDNIVLDPWRVKLSIFRVTVQWFFGWSFQKAWLLIFSKDNKYFAAFERSRDLQNAYQAAWCCSPAQNGFPLWVSLLISPYLCTKVLIFSLKMPSNNFSYSHKFSVLLSLRA